MNVGPHSVMPVMPPERIVASVALNGALAYQDGSSIHILAAALGPMFPKVRSRRKEFAGKVPAIERLSLMDINGVMP